MGWLKNIKIGPIKIKFSKAGIGVSFGMKGSKDTHIFRAHGDLYYQRVEAPEARTDIELQEIKTASAEELIACSSDNLVKEINEKQQKVELFVVGIGVLVGLFILLTFSLGIVAGMLTLPLALGLIPLKRYERKNRSIKLHYDFDAKAKTVYQGLLDSLLSLQNCSNLWRIEAQGEPKERKYSAGASALIKRSSCAVVKSVPKFLDTNVEIYQIYCGEQKLCFLPDRLLIYQGKKVGAVQYPNLNIEVGNVEFIAEGKVPKDGKQIGKAWKYINKDGALIGALPIIKNCLLCFME